MATHHSQAGRIGAHSKWSRTPDRQAATAPARQAFRDRFTRQVREQFPDADDATIARLAESARRAHYARMSMLAAAARKRYARERRGQAA